MVKRGNAGKHERRQHGGKSLKNANKTQKASRNIKEINKFAF